MVAQRKIVSASSYGVALVSADRASLGNQVTGGFTAIAHWTQQDPLEQPGDLRQHNRYGYAAGDPVNHNDPTGKLIPLAAVGAVALRVGGACAGGVAVNAGWRGSSWELEAGGR